MRPAEHRRPAARRRPQRGQARQDRQADGDGGGQVADVPHERDRLALLARGGQRREHVGDRGHDHEGAQRPQDRLAPAPERQHGHREHAREGQRPKGPERLVEPRPEPVPPHLRVVPVVDDSEVRPQLEVANRGRQRDRAQRADVGDRVADRDQVADVPVAARGQHRDAPQRRGAQARRPRGDDDDRDGEGGDRRQEGQLRPGRQSGRDPRDGQCGRGDRAPGAAAATQLPRSRSPAGRRRRGRRRRR